MPCPALARLAALSLLVLAACRAQPAAEAGRPDSPESQAREHIARIAAPGRPSLEEIFLLPGPQGVPPQLESLSASGEWALVRWTALQRDERGVRSLDEQSSPRLVHLGASTDTLGSELAAWLPPESASSGSARARLSTTWSESGARLAVVRGRELYLLELGEPDAEPVVRLLHADPSAAEPSGDDARADDEQDGEPDSKQDDSAGDSRRERPTRLGRGARVSFRDGDTRLRIETRAELLEVQLDATGDVLEGARWISEPLYEDAAGVQWSDDDRVAFRDSRPVAQVPAAPAAEQSAGEVVEEIPAEPTADDPDAPEAILADEPEPEPKPELLDAQVLHLEDGRAVVLAGFRDLKGRESERLSPDGRWVFAFEVDRSAQPDANLVPDYLSERVSTRTTRRERADDGPSPRTVWMWDTDSGARLPLDWEASEGASLWPLGWAPQPAAADGTRAPARFALARTSADYRERELWCFEAGSWRRLLVERDTHWVGGPAGGPRWSVDGSALLVPSETLPGTTTPGRCQLFRLDPATGRTRQLTQVQGELDEFSQRDDGGLLLTASQADPARRELLYLATPLDAPAQRLPAPAGFLERPRSAGSRVVFAHSTLGQPAELWTLELGAEQAVPLATCAPAEFTRADWILPERLVVAGARGAQVNSHVYLPPDSDLQQPDRPRACVVFVHGAGYLQNVTDSLTEYPVNFMFHSRLARMGYVVLDTDYRGSKGYGGSFRGELQYHLGGLDLDDIARSVDELVARGVVDPQRVGLYGGSYGGFLTLMALFTQPERWSCGAALRSVTDWRSYHPGYTVPRLGRPSTHPEAYTLSSPIDHAAGLRAPLLLLHGMRDSNVFAQDSIRLMESLIDQGKSFEAMLYPSQNHAFEDGMHWLDEYRRIEEFMLGNLGAP